ncbi:N-(5'-phosphoribosyl)anthranilate isomerase [Hymenobacter amundsenii]|uniref:N-(5'-phosphoribosyl)anthranilate isomerase n=2 Tax=Hymenobacter amundsenii TaxID=2006685 RepID=A0A246FNB7_9BACT|nr:N-(5'-phosphoribosyl)anthranilate isomerase [Hymenobacter amundsenii]
MHIKVCGMKYAENIQEVAGLEPDLIGFIFYSKSKRFVGQELEGELLRSLPPTLCKVGVFVNESTPEILRRVACYGLDLVQLHGDETPAQCAELRAADVGVIKAFAVGEAVDFAVLEPYVPHCDYFLFDTLGPQPGGNGTRFDWELLRRYDLPVPYLLAGGIGPEQAQELAQLTLPGLYGFDLNSHFETAPGRKDPVRLQAFLTQLRTRPAAGNSLRTSSLS